MSSISKNKTLVTEKAGVLLARTRARSHRIARAKDLAAQIKPQFDGSILIQRFSLKERTQHFILIFSFTILGFTGLMQTFSTWYPIAWVINTLLGGVDTLRVIHHLAAIIFILQTLLHGFDILNYWFVKRDLGGMLPAWSDLAGLIGMLKYNLGLSNSRPQFDRFSVEEKLEYWALWWGAIIMGLTGIFQWYPSLVTQILPGGVIPMARLVHMLEAILAVLAILIWHLYHTVIKERNLSIFTGHMTEHEMEENHPIELHRILKAREFLNNYKTAQPIKVELQNAIVEETAVEVDEPAIQIEESTVQQAVE
jgi:formate dehydrogenase gamma subunit